MKRMRAKKGRAFQEGLLRWYRKGRRRLPWRNGRRNAYQILVAEIMLRKTDALKVAAVYDSFLSRYPTPQALAKADIRTLRREIRSLGIVDRARLLKSLGAKIVHRHGGRVPAKYEALVGLPGVGRYTANAVLCFAFRRDVPIVDTNVIRVFARVFSVHARKARPRDDPQLWDFAGRLSPQGKACAYNRAVLDFAAQICTSRNPKHDACPLREICDFHAKL